jgi:diguanylate cyclase (GGDEF)-like protein/PAS domain S-box-containing protein
MDHYMEGRRNHILLVEDEESHATLIRRAFDEDSGEWRLEVVDGLEKARLDLNNKTPDLAIIDLVLPDGHGIDLLPADGGDQNHPTIVLTAHGDEQIAVEAMKAGAFDYVVKTENSMVALPRIARRCLREWQLGVDRRAAEIALKESEERYRTLVEDMPSLICRYLPSGELTFGNDQFCEFFGMTPERLPGQNFFLLLSKDSRKIVQGNLATLTPTQPVSTYEYPEQLPGGNVGWQKWTDRALFDREGKLVEYQSMGEDITKQKQIEQELIRWASHDFLTSLPNRRLFQDRLDLALSKSRRYEHLLGLLYIDLDEFKLVNDSYGHAYGDKVLQAVGERLQSCIREVDTVARLGGDEFTIIVEQPHSLEAVLEVLHRILEKMSRPFVIDQHKVNLTTSIGVGIYPYDAEGSQLLLKRADNAMYVAKAKGKNQYHFPSFENTRG